jgi:hypothetical protein
VPTWRASACTSLEAVRVCKFAAVDQAEANDMVVVERGDGRRVEWPVATWVSTVTDFVVLQKDLDGDGRPELVVASRASESNGFAVRSWQVAIVDGTRDAATHFVSQDWGPDSLSGTSLLLTEWETALEAKPVFVGREYAYRNGRLEPSKEPIRRRELSEAFEAERAAATALTRSPRQYLAHGTTSKEDALPETRQLAVVRGLTVDVPFIDLHLEGPNGELDSLSSSTEANDGPALRLGDAKTRRLYPLGYAPEECEKWLVGKKVSLALRGDKPNGTVWVGQ